MKTKEAIKIRKSMKACKKCKTVPTITALTQPVDIVLWVRRRSSNTNRFQQMMGSTRCDCFVGSSKTCRKHRRQIVRATQVLFEIDFQPDGSIDEVVPTVGKGRSWWTLFLLDPSMVKNKNEKEWLSQGRALGQMIRGLERLPTMPRKLKGLTDSALRDQLEWELESYGYFKAYLATMGEAVVVAKDDDVKIPSGYSNAPVFTIQELTRLRHLVGMKPDPEIMQGVWLLKKHLGATVVGG